MGLGARSIFTQGGVRLRTSKRRASPRAASPSTASPQRAWSTGRCNRAASSPTPGAYGAPVIPLARLAGGVAGEAAHLHGQAADAAVRCIYDPAFQACAANAINHIVDICGNAGVGVQAGWRASR